MTCKGWVGRHKGIIMAGSMEKPSAKMSFNQTTIGKEIGSSPVILE